jgi:hypothetical protein
VGTFSGLKKRDRPGLMKRTYCMQKSVSSRVPGGIKVNSSGHVPKVRWLECDMGKHDLFDVNCKGVLDCKTGIGPACKPLSIEAHAESAHFAFRPILQGRPAATPPFYC